MTTWSHLMIGTIIFGPRAEMVAGTLTVDTFDYLNWITRYFTGRLPLKLLKSDPKKFDEIIDSGPIWQLHQFFNYTLWSLAASLYLAFYFHSIFFGSWAIHVFLDYFTHKNYYLFFPIRAVKIKSLIIDYNLKNSKKTLIIDAFLFVVMVIRLIYF